MANIQLSAGRFQFVNVEIDEAKLIADPTGTKVLICAAQDLANELKKMDDEKRYRCEHMFAQQVLTKTGKRFEECSQCGATRWLNEDGSISQWRYPTGGK